MTRVGSQRHSKKKIIHNHLWTYESTQAFTTLTGLLGLGSSTSQQPSLCMTQANSDTQ